MVEDAKTCMKCAHALAGFSGATGSPVLVCGLDYEKVPEGGFCELWLPAPIPVRLDGMGGAA